MKRNRGNLRMSNLEKTQFKKTKSRISQWKDVETRNKLRAKIFAFLLEIVRL